MCFGGGDKQVQQANRPAYTPETSHTAVAFEKKPDTRPEVMPEAKPVAAVTTKSPDTGLNLTGM
jgi:hypothetical protein